MGSGAGFPGLVLAIMGVPNVHLIESDARKCVFLAEAARMAGLEWDEIRSSTDRASRRSTDLRADVVTARACAPLAQLLAYAEPFLRAD